jgi:hypothetical protein
MRLGRGLSYRHTHAQPRAYALARAHDPTDDTGRETVTVIERFRFLHRAILLDQPPINRTT